MALMEVVVVSAARQTAVDPSVAEALAAYQAAQSRWDAVGGSDVDLHDAAAAELFAADRRLRVALREARAARAEGRPAAPMVAEEAAADPWWADVLGYAAFVTMLAGLGLVWLGPPVWSWVGIAVTAVVAGTVIAVVLAKGAG